ncbi:MAG: glycosyltransferase [Pseudolabrys sp.]|nr:glycosyltransferase [Pseudolabrys sp.]MDP2297481.1 glycosyltransferase [Pseudolabrys sp.]
MSNFSIRERPPAAMRSAALLNVVAGTAVAAAPRNNPITVMIVVPTLDVGAAEIGAVELVRILHGAGHRAIVVARAGRLLADVTAAGAEFVPLDVASKNPLVMLRNAAALIKLARERHCDVIHALGRAGAWSACAAARLRGIPFITSWYKGFREQNVLKRLYNGVMARGDRVVAGCDQLAQLVNDRYGTPWEKIAVVPCSIDFCHFDPAQVTRERIAAVRRNWGVEDDTKVILVTGRILRRKGHHVAVRAMQRLKEFGLTNFLCVFVGEDRGHTNYTGELWDLVLATGTMDVIRMATPARDMPAAYSAAAAVVSAAVQPEGVQRAMLEAQAMARPVIVSDLGAGPDVVLTAPAVPVNRVTGLRFPAGDDRALAAALLQLFSMPAPVVAAMGGRGRDWVLGHFDAAIGAEQMLRLYGDVVGRPEAAKSA